METIWKSWPDDDTIVLCGSYKPGMPCTEMIHCEACGIPLTVYRITAEKCVLPNFHPVCIDCGIQISEEHAKKGSELTFGGVISANRFPDVV